MGNPIELPTKDEIKEWAVTTYGHLNPDVVDYFYMGIDALYVKLGGESLLTIRMPQDKKEQDGTGNGS